MPKRTSTLRIERYLLNLAGEYRVCSELNKRGIFATVTYGCRKGADVYAIGDHNQRALRIEVKTSQKGKFVTGITQKGLLDSPTAPDFWVLFHLRPVDEERFSERFFVLSHGEMCDTTTTGRGTALQRIFPEALIMFWSAKLSSMRIAGPRS